MTWEKKWKDTETNLTLVVNWTPVLITRGRSGCIGIHGCLSTTNALFQKEGKNIQPFYLESFVNIIFYCRILPSKDTFTFPMQCTVNVFAEVSQRCHRQFVFGFSQLAEEEKKSRFHYHHNEHWKGIVPSVLLFCTAPRSVVAAPPWAATVLPTECLSWSKPGFSSRLPPQGIQIDGWLTGHWPFAFQPASKGTRSCISELRSMATLNYLTSKSLQILPPQHWSYYYYIGFI